MRCHLSHCVLYRFWAGPKLCRDEYELPGAAWLFRRGDARRFSAFEGAVGQHLDFSGSMLNIDQSDRRPRFGVLKHGRPHERPLYFLLGRVRALSRHEALRLHCFGPCSRGCSQSSLRLLRLLAKAATKHKAALKIHSDIKMADATRDAQYTVRQSAHGQGRHRLMSDAT